MFKPMKDENGDTVFGVKTGRNQYEQMENLWTQQPETLSTHLKMDKAN